MLSLRCLAGLQLVNILPKQISGRSIDFIIWYLKYYSKIHLTVKCSCCIAMLLCWLPYMEYKRHHLWTLLLINAFQCQTNLIFCNTMNYHEHNPKSFHLKTMFGLGLFCTANLLYFITLLFLGCYTYIDQGHNHRNLGVQKTLKT